MVHTNPCHDSVEKPGGKRPSPILVQCILLALLLVAVFGIYSQQTGDMSPQSMANFRAANKPTLQRAIAEYPKYWPPVYPASLYFFSKCGAPTWIFNSLTFCGTLLLFWFFAWKHYPGLPPLIPVLLIALVHGNYHNLHQITAEALFLFFAVASMLLLSRFKEHPSWHLALGLGLVTALASLSRFFGLFWIVPIVLLHLMVLNPRRSWSRRCAHGLTFMATLAVFVLPWLLHIHRLTGSFSGMSRNGYRYYPAEIMHWSELTGLDTNLKFTLKTLFIDFFSPRRTAFHSVVHEPGITGPETGVLVALLTLVLLVLAGVVVLLRRLSGTGQFRVSPSAIDTPGSLPFQYAAVYLAAIITVWTFTNNDPIYTRFLFPSYPFIILGAVAAFIRVRRHVSSHLVLLPWYLAACLFIVTNLLNIRLG